MEFGFATASQIVFGPGTLKGAPAIIRAYGSRPLIVTGRNTNRARPLLHLLESNGLEHSLFAVPGEPTIAMIHEGVAAARRYGADCVIGLGGGSALDAGKAIAIMLTNPGDVLDYLEVIGNGKSFIEPSLPFIAIPTTAGTGAEVTRNAVIGSPQHRAKASLRSPSMLPKAAIVDPELTLDLPPDVTAASGMDALTQLIEPFLCKKANPLTDALCREAIPKVAWSLAEVVQNPHSYEARENMALGSLFGGLALSNAGLGAVHGFANPIGGMYSAPHGSICAALLPHVLRTNLYAIRLRENSQGEVRFRELAALLSGCPEASPKDGIDRVESLVQQLQIPRLKKFGVSSSEVEEIVTKSQKASSMKANPVELTADELRDTLLAAI